MEISIPGISQCRDNQQEILSLSKISGLQHRSSNAIHNDVSHIRNGLYDPMVLSRLTRIVSAYSKISVHSNSNKSHQLPIQREILIVGYWTINGYAHITRFQIIFQIIYISKISLQDIKFQHFKNKSIFIFFTNFTFHI